MVNEIVPADGIAARPPLAGPYTRIAMTQVLRRLIEADAGYGLALEEVARDMAAQG